MTAGDDLLPRVLVVSLGGTITMTAAPGTGGIRPTLTADQLLAAEPRLAQVAALEAVTPMSLPGASLTVQHLREVAALLRAGLDGAPGSPVGAVVVQGTDTIEDTAFVLDLLATQGGAPVVVTGAMRGPQAPGADGPANLLAAVTAAADTRLRGLGAVVVLNDEIHAARWVQKAHTGFTSAFESPGAGRIGAIVEGRVQLLARPEGRIALPTASILSTAAVPAVAQVPLGLGDDGRLLPALAALGYAGAVIEGMGAGHVPSSCAEALGSLAAQMPVVLCTRVRAGRVFTKTYGFPGSEMDLLERGLVAAGHITAGKARLLLSLLLSAGTDRAGIGQVFGQL
ncbi:MULTISPECIES: asparaginase [Ramlibacter]|uniref:Asparaginase n=1 Tax=Ramlibacter pinisoli TaxID=2682844 RepID=A0A6N8IXG6_9BURK|nr:MULTISPECIES: asparaginase [Ramlibacter]MBA2961721.1 asparaginase [Ramlibacter sp. CGMCC 1.13660]MVQ31664.1 asparaginase [Ramlibacter pinisoli]